VKNMRKLAFGALIFVTALSVPESDAVARKRPKAELAQPCPLDESIRVGSGQAISRYSLLANCAGKIIIAPANDVELRQPIRIVPQYLESETPIENGVVDTLSRPAMRIAASNVSGNINANNILALRPVTYTTPFDRTIHDVANRHRVDPLLLHAVIKQESGYRQSVRSHAGALGLMQIMPATGASLGVATPDLVIPESNVDAGARLLKRLYYKYNGDFQLVLAAYNAGEGAVQKYGNRVPPYAETQNYVKSVLAHYDRLVTDAIGPGAGR
jgi:soluble lytic murein transglycosylase-like protein